MEPLVLSVETATAKRSVALTRGTRLLALSEREVGVSASTSVLSDIDAALQEGASRLSEIDLFAVATGPGSFTGLRAGLATIKSFAATLERPVVGVPTLHAIAHGARPAGRLLALIPAGRGEVFAQCLCVTAGGEVTELEGPPAHLTPQALIAHQGNSRGNLKWAGGGAQASAALIRAGARAASFDFAEETVENSSAGEAKDGGHERGVWVLARPVEILAPDVAALALRAFRAGLAVGAADLEALYVRASDAELNERWRAQQSLRREIQSDTPSAG